MHSTEILQRYHAKPGFRRTPSRQSNPLTMIPDRRTTCRDSVRRPTPSESCASFSSRVEGVEDRPGADRETISSGVSLPNSRVGTSPVCGRWNSGGSETRSYPASSTRIGGSTAPVRTRSDRRRIPVGLSTERRRGCKAGRHERCNALVLLLCPRVTTAVSQVLSYGLSEILP